MKVHSNIIKLIIIIITIKLNQAYNFDSDKLILRKHYQNNKGPNFIQIKNFKNNYSTRSKRMDKKPSEVIFRVNGLSDENGGISGNFHSLFEPEQFFTSLNSKKLKREIPIESYVNETNKRTENTKKTRSLFADLIEIPASKNITFTSPSQVDAFNIDPYKEMTASPQNYSNDLRDIQLLTEQQFDTETPNTVNQSVQPENFEIPNDFYMPSNDNTFMYDYQKVLGIPDSNKTILKPVERVKPNENESNGNEVFNLLNMKNYSTEIEPKHNKLGKPMFYKKNNKYVNSWESHSPITKQDIVNNNYKLKQYLANIRVKGDKPFSKEELKKKYNFVTEIGLLKVLSLLTKTFKKIVKQHEEIKTMHKELIFASRDFMEKRKEILKGLKLFNKKSELISKHNNHLANLQLILTTKQEAFIRKETELLKKRQEFELLQRKFAMQQRQFYRLQKIVTSKNDRIYAKQNEITKKQYEIAKKQNAFADFMAKTNNILDQEKAIKTIVAAPTSTSGPLKINLKNSVEMDYVTKTEHKIVNKSNTKLVSKPKRTRFYHDKEILKEKDFRDIDDLVYKNYFNNTHISEIINSPNKHNQRENTILDLNDNKPDKITTSINVKNKELTKPKEVYNKHNERTYSKTEKPLIRKRRWLDRRNKKLKGGKLKPYRRFRYTTIPASIEKITEKQTTTEKVTTQRVTEPQNSDDTDEIESKQNNARFKSPEVRASTVGNDVKPPISDAELLTMAKRYCNEIDQNSNEFSFNWCVDKALRRANTLQSPVHSAPPVTKPTLVDNVTKPNDIQKEADYEPKPTENSNITDVVPVYDKIPMRLALTTPTTTTTTTTVKPKSTLSPYFPDNDELEAKIQEFELPKHPADGTVFWDASVHASQYQFPDDQTDNDGASDHMPGDDDGSDALTDPVVLELRAKKRAYVRQLNKAILKKVKVRKSIGK